MASIVSLSLYGILDMANVRKRDQVRGLFLRLVEALSESSRNKPLS